MYKNVYKRISYIKKNKEIKYANIRKILDEERQNLESGNGKKDLYTNIKTG